MFIFRVLFSGLNEIEFSNILEITCSILLSKPITKVFFFIKLLISIEIFFLVLSITR